MKKRVLTILFVLGIGVLVTIAYQRSGLLNLPDVPEDITIKEAGLANLEKYKSMAAAIEGRSNVSGSDALAQAAQGVAAIQNGNSEEGLRLLKEAVKADPTNLLIGNALRMQALNLKRTWIQESAARNEIDVQFPAYLEGQPIAFYRELLNRNDTKEVKFQLAMALVDHMILYPALEIKAPSSVESVELLTDIIENSGPQNNYYVPALYARGLNYLYRPYNLVWPEKIAASPTAASDDLAKCVAIGQQVGGGSDELKAELSLALGDAYAKERRFNQARSWWQIAKGIAGTADMRERVQLRLTWEDDKVQPELARLLDQQINNIDEPLSDMRFLWN